MDQYEFSQFVMRLAQEYYASPRSTKIPTPRGPKDLRDLELGQRSDVTWALEDFANHLKES